MSNISKEEFKLLAEKAIKTICDIPDDIWQFSFPCIRMDYKEDTIFVGIQATLAALEAENQTFLPVVSLTLISDDRGTKWLP